MEHPSLPPTRFLKHVVFPIGAFWFGSVLGRQAEQLGFDHRGVITGAAINGAINDTPCGETAFVTIPARNGHLGRGTRRLEIKRPLAVVPDLDLGGGVGVVSGVLAEDHRRSLYVDQALLVTTIRRHLLLCVGGVLLQ